MSEKKNTLCAHQATLFIKERLDKEYMRKLNYFIGSQQGAGEQ